MGQTTFTFKHVKGTFCHAYKEFLGKLDRQGHDP